jgi:molybdate transport system substrate-binding protein
MTKRTAVAACLLAGIAACSTSAASARTLTIFTAASLRDSLERIAVSFERAHPGTTVRLSVGPSDGLALQIQAGAEADLFASASPKWIDAVATDPGVLGRAVFARNHLVLIVPKRNAAHIAGIADVARSGIRLVLAAQGVPAGDYARQALRNAGIYARAMRNVASNEIDVSGVVQKIVVDEADAGIAYATDLTPALGRDIRVIELPNGVDVIARDEVAIVNGTKVTALARAFIDYLMTVAQAALRNAGFLRAG